MKELAILLRKMQLLTHMMHNLVSGSDFLLHHEFLGELYPEYEADYDDVIERIIGLYGVNSIDLLSVQISAVDELKHYPIDPFNVIGMFEVVQNCEKELCDYVKKLCSHPGMSEGSKQLVGEIANKSEARQYKLKQIIAKKPIEVKV